MKMAAETEEILAADDPESPENVAKRAGRIMDLMHDIFAYGAYGSGASSEKEALKTKILSEIEAQSMLISPAPVHWH